MLYAGDVVEKHIIPIKGIARIVDLGEVAK